jgi:hypothetical protein
MVLLNNVENLRENSGIFFVNNEKNVGVLLGTQHEKFEGKCGISFVNNSEKLRENLQYFLLIVWKT